jgi:hypothetical protein
LKIKAVAEHLSGDRLPSDTWRVTLYVNGNWQLYREWSCGINDEKAEIEAKKVAKLINTALAQIGCECYDEGPK